MNHREKVIAYALLIVIGLMHFAVLAILYFNYVHWPFLIQWPVYVVLAFCSLAGYDAILRKVIFEKEESK